MAQATIQSVKQTETAGLFTICFEAESYTEFQKFIMKGTIKIEETNIEGVDDKIFEI